MSRGGLRLRVVSVGRDRDFTAAGVAEYADRIGRSAELTLIELRAQTGPSAPEREAESLLAAHGKQRGAAELWALDQRGEELSSEDLALRIGRLRDAATALTLCIGGDEGLAPRVREAARFSWSLSRLTLPHRLARLVALEQVYRALEILRGSPYHK
ncbi:MAG: 23S rRNA (pseudouridine(1915)-N(3))-methyltransferase RlmH [Myxococcales bacterium]